MQAQFVCGFRFKSVAMSSPALGAIATIPCYDRHCPGQMMATFGGAFTYLERHYHQWLDCHCHTCGHHETEVFKIVDPQADPTGDRPHFARYLMLADPNRTGRSYYHPGFGRPVASIPALNDYLDVAEQVAESMYGGDYQDFGCIVGF